MKAEIIAVGSELLTPDRMDTNSLFLTEELNKLGIEVVRKSIVGDNRDYLGAAFKEALERVELIIASGGLKSLADIEKLCAVESEGIEGVICGRAIYTGDLDFATAQKRADELSA